MHPVRAQVMRVLGHLDSLLLLIVLTLLAIGVAVVASASGQSPGRISGHLVNIAIALMAMLVVANVPPHQLARIGPPLYVLAVAMLLAVALFGEVRNGSRRWLNLGFIAFQPSELLKFALPLAIAWFFQNGEGRLTWRHYGAAAALVVVPALLILRQPDLGTTLLILGSGAFLLFFAGLSWKIIAGLAALGGASMPLVWHLLHDYQRRRILTLLDPQSDPLGAGYHINQSTIAIGSGGIFGKGWAAGTQSQLDFIPERTTDFVFAVFSEEFGLVGTVLLVALYIALVVRGLAIAWGAPTLFGRLVAATLSMNLFVFVFVNIGMVSGLLPVVGVPLPFVSYGGTALVSMMLGVGILMSIATHRQINKS